MSESVSKPGGPLAKGLRAGAVGVTAATVIGAASTAPAYSLASTLGPLSSETGMLTPLVLVVSALPMLLIAVAFRELNRVEPDCGTSFAWVARAFGPRLGWLAGWGVIVPCVLVMANLAQVAAIYTFSTFGADGLATSRLAQAGLGVAYLALLTWLCYRGIQTTARMQAGLLIIEVGLLLVLAAVALWRVANGDLPGGAPGFSADLLDLGSLTTGTLTAGFMLAVFLYWGWDSAVAVNEETVEPSRNPGRAALLSLGLVIVGYAVVALAAFTFAGPQRLTDAGDDVFSALGPALLGGVGGVLLSIAVLTSAVASAQTTILPTARALLAMGTYRALPDAFGKIHPKYKTPSTATIGMGLASVTVYLVTIGISENVLADSVTATALTITFYYALTALACPWYFRQAMTTARDKLMRGVLPFLGGLVMAVTLVRTCYDLATGEAQSGSPLGIGAPLWIAAGSILIGVVLMVIQQRRQPVFFTGKLAGPGDEVADGLARLP